MLAAFGGLFFLSGVFIPENEIPEGVLSASSIFPVREFFQAFLASFDPAADGPGFPWLSLVAVAAWGLLGLLLAIRYFRWEPRR
jgi:ABC-2 type transport system permease protein